ncbi:CPA1 sodium and/or potassium/proton antiporter (plasmid) [Alkalihalophilus pseudofirmus OF4]|uniref:CPA1 sodium and/or potassium/proton antiporter n=2 Tax=Alkalihalophilus TaxID=2893060 RepID=D3G1T6_ALKPO|nr:MULTISPECIES: potassium/proton antiporter [Alkalihalophilus]ADC52312.1 CPA1 sodium and/or potassium/proton antiporter [Alkalihalophilus pseudofirmus OF4]ERN51540.1 potassium transporter CPA [Alkalihalophilus marmarensis DSM 21297]MED1603319.1 potassium/proton antiporter [Alkalihalophilus marmarensis]WEG19243.1 potassium/proton antiporter [Alkalihalophilus pseudofirmus]
MFDQSYNDYFILLSALLLIIGVLTTKFSSRVGVPALILFILVGMLTGSDGLGLIHFDNPQLAQLIGIFALIIILFEGGLQTKWSTVKSVTKPALSLATLGVILTTVIVALAAKLILGVSWLEGFLFGAIVGSTDAAAVFAVLKGQNIRARLGATLEAESGSNDPMAMFLTIFFIELILTESPSYLLLVGSFFWQMGIGLIVGILLGRLATFAINQINLDSSGLYPVFALAFALLTYSLTDIIGASGLLAVYVAALVIGNSDLTYRQSIFRFNEGFAWMAQILMFTILGLLVFPSQLITLDVIIKGLLLSITLVLIARPVAVFLSTMKMGYDLKERIFLSWAGLRGAVPIVLATFPLLAGLENSQLFFNVVFFVVLISALVQGSTIAIFAEKLGLIGPTKIEPPHSLELVSIGKANAEILEFEVSEESNITNKRLAAIDFPKDVLINAIIRTDELITPYGETEIKVGDILYILVSRESKKELKKMLQQK